MLHREHGLRPAARAYPIEIRGHERVLDMNHVEGIHRGQSLDFPRHTHVIVQALKERLTAERAASEPDHRRTRAREYTCANDLHPQIGKHAKVLCPRRSIDRGEQGHPMMA